ncbi:MAG: hypothetical protein GY940_15725 [bacterium]|nr:hypothetical protein [bacterium]
MMNNCQTVRDVLGKKFGDEKSTSVMNRINQAYKNGTRGEKFNGFLNKVIEKERTAEPDKQRLMPPIIYQNSE